jgi:hypothetical protein
MPLPNTFPLIENTVGLGDMGDVASFLLQALSEAITPMTPTHASVANPDRLLRLIR